MPEIFVLFDKPNAVYAAGQKISGRVVFSTASQQNPRWIDVQLHGRSHTFFTRQESETKTNSKGESETKTHTVHYTATAKHLDTAVPLWRKTDKAARLLPGKYEWQFWFQLPCSVLPPSFEGNNGNIRYWVRAEVSRSWKFNIVDESSFEIAPFLDLNTMPIARTPLDGFAVKNLGCCCFRNGNVELRSVSDEVQTVHDIVHSVRNTVKDGLAKILPQRSQENGNIIQGGILNGFRERGIFHDGFLEGGLLNKGDHGTDYIFG